MDSQGDARFHGRQDARQRVQPVLRVRGAEKSAAQEQGRNSYVPIALHPDSERLDGLRIRRLGNPKTLSARIRVLGQHRCGRGRVSIEITL
jgi:hypothetical protein